MASWTWLWISEPRRRTSTSRLSRIVRKCRRSWSFSVVSRTTFSAKEMLSVSAMTSVMRELSVMLRTAIFSSSGKFGANEMTSWNCFVALRTIAAVSTDMSGASGKRWTFMTRYGFPGTSVMNLQRDMPRTRTRTVPSGNFRVFTMRASAPTDAILRLLSRNELVFGSNARPLMSPRMDSSSGTSGNSAIMRSPDDAASISAIIPGSFSTSGVRACGNTTMPLKMSAGASTMLSSEESFPDGPSFFSPETVILTGVKETGLFTSWKSIF